MAKWVATFALGLLMYGCAWLWAAAGDSEGGANIGAGLLALFGIAATLGGILGLVVTGLLHVARRRRAR